MSVFRRHFASGLLLLGAILPAFAAAAPGRPAAFSSDDQKTIDAIVGKALAATGVPSASIAVVKGGRIVYAQAYGRASLDPVVAARPEMRYSVGSISKQFAASAILLLQQEGKLSLDDPVAKFLPGLTRGREVTIRQLLTHTSGYRDFWPQDYVPPGMLKAVTPQQILGRWARIPLDFDPGTKWQYSNTNYVIAGLVVEKASGRPFMQFLADRIFKPLDLRSVLDVNQGRLTESDARGYLRYARGRPRPAPKEGPGWLFTAGGLAMTASDLARWDISLIDRSLLSAASYRALETEQRLKNGVGTGYALGVSVELDRGRRRLEHGGEVSGFTAVNVVFPDDRAAIVVLTNMDAARAAGQIAKKITPVLFPAVDEGAAARLHLARTLFHQLQRGTLDRSLLTPNCSSYFSDQAIKDFSSSLAPLGKPREFKQTEHRERGGMDFRAYTVTLKRTTLRITLRQMPDGKVEQFQIAAE